MNNRKNILLSELVDKILKEMALANYSCETIKLYRRIYNRLENLAISTGKRLFDKEMADMFLADASYVRDKGYCHSRFCLHNRCIDFLEIYMKTGIIDWSVRYQKPENEKLSTFKVIWEDFCFNLKESPLRENTIDGYKRIVLYFLQYCESKRYQLLKDIQPGNVMTFLGKLCMTRYQPTSLGAHLPGLKLFLESNDSTRVFVREIPLNLKRRRNIIPVLDDIEQKQLLNYLENRDLSYRDKAICLLSLETGLRSVDICALKLGDVDWLNDCIHILQQKTNESLDIPLMPSFGNAMADYLLHERPVSESNYIFLQKNAPFEPITTHAACWKILHNAFREAGILKEGRICGTRLTRHNAASRMLRKGIPLPVISAALGHHDPNSVNIYLTTDEAKLSECTLPLPETERRPACHE
jgi:site-specific recombinase XerD